MRMSFQSASSSSATIWASAVPTPWPISALVMWTVTAPSGVMVSAAFGSNDVAAPASSTPPGIVKRSVRPTPAAAVDLKNSRRLKRVVMATPPARRA